eukprot:9367248-Pyramimonas_sp.AAC.1
MLLSPLHDGGEAERLFPNWDAQQQAERYAPGCDSDRGVSAGGVEFPRGQPGAQVSFPIFRMLASPLLDESRVEVVGPLRLRSQYGSCVDDLVDVLGPQIVSEAFERNEEGCAPVLDRNLVGASLLSRGFPDGQSAS